MVTYKSNNNGSINNENIILPTYTMQLPRRDQQQLPDLPLQNIPQSQQYKAAGTEPVQYYVLENTGENPAF